MGIIEKGFNQWKFVHTLLKATVLNVITSINYMKLVPDGVTYIKTGKDIKRADTRRAYVSVMKVLDEMNEKNMLQNGRHEHLKFAIQTMFTIADTDHLYSTLLNDMFENHKILTSEQIEEYCKNEKGYEIKKQDFVQRIKQEEE